MKIIVTHISPDWDAVGSVWLIKRYLAGWEDAEVRFVPAGQRAEGLQVFKSSSYQVIKLSSHQVESQELKNPIERTGEDEVIHVDTGLGPLDHHHTSDQSISAMSLTWDFIQQEIKREGNKFTNEHLEAITRIVRIVVDIDHFREVFWKDAAADYHEFSLLGLLDGIKYERPDQDNFYVGFGITCLNAILVNFENRIWAEKEIDKGKRFTTRYGKGIGFETVNDTVLKLAQKMGYVIVVRKDPRKKYVRIKAIPSKIPQAPFNKGGAESGRFKNDIDLTLAYEQLKKIDPDATWFLHVSGKMLLNGTPKNPKMRPTKLGLDDIIKVLEKL